MAGCDNVGTVLIAALELSVFAAGAEMELIASFCASGRRGGSSLFI